MEKNIYTIGHSTHTAERFIELLKLNGITAVCDVRSMPIRLTQNVALGHVSVGSGYPR